MFSAYVHEIVDVYFDQCVCMRGWSSKISCGNVTVL